MATVHHNSTIRLSTVPSDCARALKAQGRQHFTEGSYISAVEAWTRGLTHASPTDHLYAELLCNRSAGFLYLDNPEAALQDAEACMQLHPDFSKAYFRRGEALFALGRDVESAEAFSAHRSMSSAELDGELASAAHGNRSSNTRGFLLPCAEFLDKHLTAAASYVRDLGWTQNTRHDHDSVLGVFVPMYLRHKVRMMCVVFPLVIYFSCSTILWFSHQRQYPGVLFELMPFYWGRGAEIVLVAYMYALMVHTLLQLVMAHRWETGGTHGSSSRHCLCRLIVTIGWLARCDKLGKLVLAHFGGRGSSYLCRMLTSEAAFDISFITMMLARAGLTLLTLVCNHSCCSLSV